jgi:chromosome segregation ATPase
MMELQKLQHNKLSVIKAQSETLTQEQSVNKALSLQINNQNRSMAKLRSKLSEIVLQTEKRSDELLLVQSDLEGLESDCKKETAEIEQLNVYIINYEKKIEIKHKALQKAEVKLESCLHQMSDVKMTAKEAEAMLKQREEELEHIVKEENELKVFLFKAQSELSELQREEQKLKRDIKNAKATQRNLQSKIAELDKRA